MKEQVTIATKVLTQLDRQCDEITHQRDTVKAEICDSSKRLHETIDTREDYLIGQLNQITRRKLKSLASQKEQITILQVQLNSCIEFTRESLKTDTQLTKVLGMKRDILGQARDLTAALEPLIFTLNTKADIVFSASTNVAAAACSEYGRVYASNSPDPSKCSATGKGTREAIIGEKATVILKAISYEGQPCDGGTTSTAFKVDLVPKKPTTSRKLTTSSAWWSTVKKGRT